MPRDPLTSIARSLAIALVCGCSLPPAPGSLADVVAGDADERVDGHDAAAHDAPDEAPSLDVLATDDLPDAPSERDGPFAPDAPSERDAPVVTDAPSELDAPGASDASDASDVPAVPDAPGARDVADVTACPDRQTRCGDVCVSAASSTSHCGACGNACPMRANAPATCVAGVCAFVCATGFGDCNGVPDDGCEAALASDATHCGGCRRSCSPGTACMAGVCTATCAAPRMTCGGVCVDTSTDVRNCGACASVCPTAQACVAGRCQCGAGQTLCGVTCVNVASRFDEALALIEQAERIGPTAGTRMLSARLFGQMGRMVASHGAAEQCLQEADADAQTTTANRRALREECTQLRDDALRRLARLTVRVARDAPAELAVTLNDAPLRSALYNVEQLVEAGTVRISATMRGRASWQHTQPIAAGASAVIDVEVPPEQPSREAARAGAAVGVLPPEREAPPSDMRRPLAWATGITGVALLGGAVVSGLMFRSTESSYERDQCATRARTDACSDQFGTLETLNTLQWVGYIGGAALTVTSVVLFATTPSRRRAPSVSFGVAPSGAVGVQYETQF